MSFILIEHDRKPIRLKGKKVVPATISVIHNKMVLEGTYIGLSTGYNISLVNSGGFLSVAPEMKEAYYLANIIPATLSENACDANNGEIFAPVNSNVKIVTLMGKNDYDDKWPDFLQDFWIPSKFYKQETMLGYGWFKKGEANSEAILIDIKEEIKSCIRVCALLSEKVQYECANFEFIKN